MPRLGPLIKMKFHRDGERDFKYHDLVILSLRRIQPVDWSLNRINKFAQKIFLETEKWRALVVSRPPSLSRVSSLIIMFHGMPRATDALYSPIVCRSINSMFTWLNCSCGHRSIAVDMLRMSWIFSHLDKPIINLHFWLWITPDAG